jgi:RND family efflux transporter MFP subunit
MSRLRPPAFVAVAGCLLAAGCESSAPADSPSQAAAPAAVPTLDVVPVISQQLHTTVRLPGELSPYEVVAIYPRVSGFVEEVPVDRGSPVERGQLLARLAAPELASQRAEAEARVAGGRSTAERLQAASTTPGVVAKHDMELAAAALAADEAKLRSLRTLEDYLIVRAPFGGVVTERNVHPGALVGPPTGGMGTPMLRVEQVTRLRLTVAVPEADAGAVAEGAKATFAVRAWPGKRFEGVIRRISHSVDPHTRAMPVELDVDNATKQLAPGMFADVDWPIQRAGQSLLVPASAVAQTPERTYVDRVKDGAVERVTVGRGIALGDKVEVFGALAPGDQVLRRGSEELKDGARVQTKPWTPDGGVR